MMKQVTLENKNSVVTISLEGGAYTDFHLKENHLNPISWKQEDSTQPPFRGHFLCFDRWGPPSEGEQKNGFKHHGEAIDQVWDLLKEHEQTGDYIESCMRCILPMGRLQLTRCVQLSVDQPLLKVTEKIENLNKFGRIYNIVQHVTLAPPFLDRNTLFDNNTEIGFEDKEDGSLNQEKPVMKWPHATYKKQRINLRQFQHEWPRVSSFKFRDKEKLGWTTACNTGKNLMIGYVWETQDYPWVNYWRSMNNGSPIAFGIEFGTTGLHEPFPVIAKKGKIFGLNIYDFIDANEEKEKSFLAFLAAIPSDYKGVAEIIQKNSQLIIKEKKSHSRDIIFHL